MFPVSTKSIVNSNPKTLPIAIDQLLVEKGEIGNNYPTSAFCSNNFEIPCEEIGLVSDTCDGRICGVVEYNIKYSGASFSIWSSEYESESSQYPANSFSYPGDMTVSSRGTWPVHETPLSAGEHLRNIGVGVVEALVLQLNRFHRNGATGEYVLSSSYSSRRMSPICQPRGVITAVLTARYGSREQGIISNSIS